MLRLMIFRGKGAFLGRNGTVPGRLLRLRYILILLGAIAVFSWNFSNVNNAGAEDQAPAGNWGWSVTEIAVARSSGNQISPSLEGTTVVYNDTALPPWGGVMKKDLYGGDPEPVGVAWGVMAGPDMDGGAIAWLNGNHEVCRHVLADGSEKCVVTNGGSELWMSGQRVIAAYDGGASGIRLVDFGTGSSRLLDSSNFSGSRYGPDIEGDSAVWVRERGYAGQHYEPIIVLHDIPSTVTTYLSKPGGGPNSTGAGKYARQHPSMSGGRVVYQQKLNELNTTWDIYETAPDTYGVGVVEAPGDQINPSISGNLVVYQDNRSGHVDDTGRWVGEWNIYMKDLATGIEQPVCTAPGDQINPVIKGNTVVWQDRRSGDWDVYAAALSPAAGDVQLMEKYSPSLLMHHDEDFFPEDAGMMVSQPGTTLMEGGAELLRAPETLSLSALGGQGAGSYIDLPGKCVICGAHLPDPSFDSVIRAQFVQPYNQLAGAGGHQQTVYGRVAHLGDWTVIQYWINYYFNNHPMLSHEGDWELVEVELDADSRPSRVSVSQHGYGKMRQWRDVRINDGHPLIFVSKGSHANYFEDGLHSIAVAGMPNPAIIDEAEPFEAGKLVTPTVVPLPGAIGLDGFGWLGFSGRWGEMNGLPESDAPVGPVWSGDKWEHPFAWNGLEWDGFEGLRGQLVAIGASVSRSVMIKISDSTRSIGEDILGQFEQTIPAGQFLDAAAASRKFVAIPGGINTDVYHLEVSSQTAAQTPLKVTLPDPANGVLVRLDYGIVELAAGTVARLTVGPDSSSDDFTLMLDSNGDGLAESSLQPQIVTQALDTNAPGDVDDLQAYRRSDGAIVLRWTAPGDDGNEGTPAMYSIRYAAQPVTEENWHEAEPVAVTAAPQAGGSIETLRINDLPPAGALYFAMKTTDEAGNQSGISNIAACLSPRLALSVGSVFWGSYADYLDGSLTVRFRISNYGDGIARDVTIRQVDTNPLTVVPGVLPPPLAALETGQSGDLQIRFHFLEGPRRFLVRLYATGRDINGDEMWFPQAPPSVST